MLDNKTHSVTAHSKIKALIKAFTDPKNFIFHRLSLPSSKAIAMKLFTSQSIANVRSSRERNQ